MITAIAIDDEPLALEIIKTFCDQIDYLDLAATFTETGTALKYLEDNKVDLLFLDINMPSISGIELYKKLDKSILVIFTTAYTEYAVEGFNLDAIDYLLKPFEFDRFKKAVEKVKEYNSYLHKKETEVQQYLFVRVDYSLVKVTLADILYIEGLDNYFKIHFDNGKTLLVRMSLKSVSEKLPADEFIRVHRSFIVSLSKVKYLRNKTIHLGDTEIPVGTNYIENVRHLFNEK